MGKQKRNHYQEQINMAIQENITQNQPPIDDKAVALLYEDLKDSYDVGSLEDFKAYLSDKETRDLFFTESGWVVIRFTERQVHLHVPNCLNSWTGFVA